MIDLFLFAVFPYAAIVLAVIVSVYRYLDDRFSYSSQSSQFLESRQLFWGSVPWHYGILIVLTAHLLATIFPDPWAVLVGEPLRLYVLEMTGLILGFLASAGVLLFVVRRLTSARLRLVTSSMDWVLLILLLVQVVLGVGVAWFYRWGSIWYLKTAVPWLWSLVRLDPQIQSVTTLPLLAQIHMLNAFLLIAVMPFTRLVHLFTVPLTYLWRPYQVVIWNRRASSQVAKVTEVDQTE